jgi:hypothetical protein
VLYDNLIDVVKRIHALDWRGAGLEFLDEPVFGTTGVDQQIGHWEHVYAWAGGGTRSATIDAALEWARRERPADEELVLSWGDVRIGNIIFHPQSLGVETVLDWEMASLASPELDVGWMLYVLRYYTEGYGVPIPDGMQTREELIDAYRAATGRTIKHADYYEAFAALRVSILMMRAGQLMIGAGALPPDNPVAISNPASQILARLLGLPAPAAETGNFVGKRLSGRSAERGHARHTLTQPVDHFAIELVPRDRFADVQRVGVGSVAAEQDLVGRIEGEGERVDHLAVDRRHLPVALVAEREALRSTVGALEWRRLHRSDRGHDSCSLAVSAHDGCAFAAEVDRADEPVGEPHRVPGVSEDRAEISRAPAVVAIGEAVNRNVEVGRSHGPSDPARLLLVRRGERMMGHVSCEVVHRSRG